LYNPYWQQYLGCHVEEVAVDITVEEITEPPIQLYWKESYPDYAPSGVPDFDQNQFPQGLEGWCGPVAVSNSLWWMDSRFESGSTPPPAISDTYPLLTNYTAGIDDHNPANVVPFVSHLAYLMDTDGIRTVPPGPPHSGTNVFDMEAGIAQYLSWTGVNPQGDVNGDGTVDQTDWTIVNNAMGTTPAVIGWDLRADIFPVTTGWPNQPLADNNITPADLALVTANMGKNGSFYEHTIPRPDYYYIEEEVEYCQDVVLLLGFWYYDGVEWYREQGHYVTVAGVDSLNLLIAICDPDKDAFENGQIASGRIPVPHPLHPGNPTVHNNASLVSQDIYKVIWDPCPGGDWSIVGYPDWEDWHVQIEYAVITSPIGVHDVAVINVTHSKTPCVPMSTVSQGRTATIWATVENQGDFTETNFNVTAYAVNITASYPIGTQQVTLNPGQNTTLTFVWDTTGFTKGDYTIEVTAVLPGDNDPADNTFTDGVIRVVTPGDVNGDLCVDVFDKVSVGAAFGANRNATDGKYWHGPPDFPGPCIYCPHYANSDLNNDGTIDVFDKVIVGVNFGQGICP